MLRHVSNKSFKVKRAPYLNPDAFCRFIGPKNLGKALIDDELVSCLLDNGAQLNFIMPAYAQEWGMDIMSLEYLAEEIGGAIPLIRGLGGISVEPIGFVMMNVKVPGVEGYDEDQIAIVSSHLVASAQYGRRRRGAGLRDFGGLTALPRPATGVLPDSKNRPPHVPGGCGPCADGKSSSLRAVPMSPPRALHS